MSTDEPVPDRPSRKKLRAPILSPAGGPHGWVFTRGVVTGEGWNTKSLNQPVHQERSAFQRTGVPGERFLLDGVERSRKPALSVVEGDLHLFLRCPPKMPGAPSLTRSLRQGWDTTKHNHPTTPHRPSRNLNNPLRRIDLC